MLAWLSDEISSSVVLTVVSPWFGQQLLVALWDYVLLCEIAHKIIDTDSSWAYRDPETLTLFEGVKKQYLPQEFEEFGDFSERLVVLLTRLESRLQGASKRLSNPELMATIWQGDIIPPSQCRRGVSQTQEGGVAPR